MTSSPISANIRALTLTLAIAFLVTSIGAAYWAVLASDQLANDLTKLVALRTDQEHERDAGDASERPRHDSPARGNSDGGRGADHRQRPRGRVRVRDGHRRRPRGQRRSSATHLRSTQDDEGFGPRPAERGLPVFEYAPKRIKQATVGRGSADKNQVAFMIRALLGLTETPTADAADALAIGLTHLRAQEVARLGVPTGARI